jgi:hypothetical protein
VLASVNQIHLAARAEGATGAMQGRFPSGIALHCSATVHETTSDQRTTFSKHWPHWVASIDNDAECTVVQVLVAMLEWARQRAPAHTAFGHLSVQEALQGVVSANLLRRLEEGIAAGEAKGEWRVGVGRVSTMRAAEALQSHATQRTLRALRTLSEALQRGQFAAVSVCVMSVDDLVR